MHKQLRTLTLLTIALLSLGLLAEGMSQAATTTAFPDDAAPKTLKTSAFTLGATGTVVAAVPGRKIKVYSVKLYTSTTVSLVVNFRDGNTTAIEGPHAIAGTSGYTETINPPYSLFTTSSGTSLDLVTSGSGTVAGRVSYWDNDPI